MLSDAVLRRLDRLQLFYPANARGGAGGMRRSRALGSSVEFSDFREYVPGDDIRRVDWNAYARFDRLYLKLFMEEQETTLFVLLDASASMAGGGKWEAARAIAEALCYLALRAGDRVCFACLRGAETLESPLFAGRAAYEKASAFLDGVHPAGRTRLGERGAAVRVRGARGMAVVLSDLFSEDDWTRCPTRLLYARRQTALVHILAREELEPDVSGAIALYGEPLILDSLVRFGYSREEALRFANDGCWEVQIPGKTCFSYVPFDALAIFLHDTLRVDEETPLPYGDFEELYRAYLRDLGAKVDAICAGAIAARLETDGRGNFRWKEALPCGVVSLFEEGCVENARSYLEGGPRYTVISPHIGGAPDVGNSLLAIDRLVYREKRVTLDELRAILRANWEGHEPLRQYVLNRYTYYGNDDDAADAYTARLLDDFAAMVLGHNGESPILFPPGVSTFGRQIEWAPGRAATPFGVRKGDVLAPNASPTPGTDEAGATALIRSYCKLGLGRLTCGAALDVKLLPALARGENGANALVALMDAFVALGGFFMQIDIMDADALRAARENPQAYKSLSVRVSGWNARFVTLNEEWQNMVIERTARGM